MNRTVEKILTATTPDVLFDPRDLSERKYKNLLRRTHPDMFNLPEEKETANKAFIRLNELWEAYSNPTKRKTQATNVITTRRHTYVLGENRWKSEGYTTLAATYDAGYKVAHITLPHSPADNDLMLEWAHNLKQAFAKVDDQYKPYLPQMLESFKIHNKGVTLQAVSYSLPEGMFSLREVKEDYPEGLDAKDVAWMFRRVLIALGNTHDAGFVHGGINLDSVLIHPEFHGVILTNWQYSVEHGMSLKALPVESKGYYPEYVFAKEPASYRLDILLAAKTFQELGGDRLPRRMRAFFKGCQVSSMPEARYLLAEYDELLEDMWGERRFHHFKMRRQP
jgi:hypothetical protein